MNKTTGKTVSKSAAKSPAKGAAVKASSKNGAKPGSRSAPHPSPPAAAKARPAAAKEDKAAPVKPPAPPARAEIKPAAVPVRKSAPRQPGELSDEDLLRAPEKDYMNEAQLAFFRRRLLELRDQLLNNADDTGQHLRENEVTTDPSDRATLEEEYTLELRTRDRERKLLKKVEKSIRQIDEGTYGFCEETGEPIGVARLLARPTATLSLEAQERRERVQKLYGD